MNIAEIRQKYPQYDHASDQQLADALHEKYYSHVPKETFYEKIDFKPEAAAPEQGFFNKLPRNIAAGLTSGAAGLANLPYEGAKLIRNPGAEYIPHFGEHDYGKMFGLTGEPTTADQAIQLASEFALPVGGALKAGSKGIKAVGKAVSDLPLTRNMAAKSLKEAKKLVGERGVGNLKVEKEILNDIPQFLPKTDPYNKLMKQAAKGDYESLFTLQSDLGKHGRQLIKSSSGAERIHGMEANKTRQRLIESIQSILKSKGHEDIADLMKHGQNRYRQYNKIQKNVYQPAIKAAKKAGLPLSIGAIMELLYKQSQD